MRTLATQSGSPNFRLEFHHFYCLSWVVSTLIKSACLRSGRELSCSLVVRRLWPEIALSTMRKNLEKEHASCTLMCAASAVRTETRRKPTSSREVWEKRWEHFSTTSNNEETSIVHGQCRVASHFRKNLRSVFQERNTTHRDFTSSKPRAVSLRIQASEFYINGRPHRREVGG